MYDLFKGGVKVLEDIHVMIIDDQRAMRSIIRQLLHQQKILNISEAENGVQALSQIEALKRQGEGPDVIICDLYMEAMDGLEFVNSLRRTKDSTPIIILTGEADSFVHDVSRQVGATRVLTKPISAAGLVREIRTAIGFL